MARNPASSHHVVVRLGRSLSIVPKEKIIKRTCPLLVPRWVVSRIFRTFDHAGDPFDTGALVGLLESGYFDRTLTECQGQHVGCPEGVAFRRSQIAPTQLAVRAEIFRDNDYRRHLFDLSLEPE